MLTSFTKVVPSAQAHAWDYSEFWRRTHLNQRGNLKSQGLILRNVDKNVVDFQEAEMEENVFLPWNQNSQKQNSPCMNVEMGSWIVLDCLKSIHNNPHFK